jgi:dipeptidyl aminopeptidase/acylaminoacyl peptidase
MPDMGLLTMGYDRQTPVSVSSDGTLVYGASNPRFQLTWYDRQGKPSGTVGGPDSYAEDTLRISPDGARVAVSVPSDRNLWAIDLHTGEKGRLTRDGGGAGGLAWSPSGQQIAYVTGGAVTGMRATVFVTDVVNASPRTRLTNTPHSQGRPDWSPNGKFVLFQQTSSEANLDLWAVTTDAEHKATAFRQTPAHESSGRFSADGNWVAYISDDTGRQEVWVESFPPNPTRQQVSVDGGVDPVWRRDGRELFYRSVSGSLMAVPVRYDSGIIHFGTPAVLFSVGPAAYDVSQDGSRFLTLTPVRPSEASPLTLFLNWRHKLENRP